MLGWLSHRSVRVRLSVRAVLRAASVLLPGSGGVRRIISKRNNHCKSETEGGRCGGERTTERQREKKLVFRTGRVGVFSRQPENEHWDKEKLTARPEEDPSAGVARGK